MADTPNYGWTMPVVNASRNVWGTILNTLFGEVDTDLKAVSDAQAADAAAITSLDGRVDVLEARSPAGFVYGSGVYFWGETCQGLEEETITETNTSILAVPFNQVGTFSKVFFRPYAASVTFTLTVRDSVNGRPADASLATATLTGTGGITGTQVVDLSQSVTLSRPAWLTVTGGQVNTRGTTGALPRFTLGTPGIVPSAVTDVPTCLKLNGSTWQAIGPGTKKWAPAIGLVSA